MRRLLAVQADNRSALHRPAEQLVELVQPELVQRELAGWEPLQRADLQSDPQPEASRLLASIPLWKTQA